LDRRVFLFLVLFFYVTVACGAVPPDSIAYSKDFVFKEGLYVSYEQFKHNSPVEIKKIIFDYDKTKLDFLKAVTGKKEIVFLNDSNQKVIIKTSDIWGYCQNQAIYIRYSDDFFRVPIVGNICHFLGYQYVSGGYSNPNIFGGSQTFQGAVKEQTQFIFDNQTMQIMMFDVNTIDLILERDGELHKEFIALSNKKKRQSTFLYLRKYNEKHPLYFLYQ